MGSACGLSPGLLRSYGFFLQCHVATLKRRANADRSDIQSGFILSMNWIRVNAAAVMDTVGKCFAG